MARSVRDFRGVVVALDVALHDRAQLLHQEATPQQVRARRRTFARLRRGRRGQRGSPTPGESPDEALARQQVEAALEQAIAALEPMYREVLLLRDVEGLTAPEVAEVLGVSVQAVKSRLHRARLSVRARVAPLLGIEPGPPAPGGCPDVLTMFSQHLEDEISADALRRDGTPSRRLRALPRDVRLAQADARAVPHGRAFRAGPGVRTGVGQDRAPQLPRGERLNPFRAARLSMIMEGQWRP